MEIKQDINLLEKPTWFLVGNSKDSEGKVWKDVDGYVYRAGYKLPDKSDMLFLFYFLLKTQECGYKTKVSMTRYEVLKACGLAINDKSYARLEDSLKRWTNVTLEFQGTFYDGKDYISILFHIMDSAKIKKEDKHIEVCFNTDFLLKVKESKFFKYINFDYYKSLRRGVSRRLFEILCKNFKGRSSWEIDLIKLGTKLTLSKRKRQRKEGIKEVMFHSDVLLKLKPSINEINRLAENEDLFRSLDIPSKEAFIIEYELKNEKKVIRFIKKTPDWVKNEKRMDSSSKIEQQEIVFEEDADLTQLYELLKSSTKLLKEELGKYHREKGFDYVKWNIEYANKTATKSYATYLKKCLKEDWGAEFRETETKKRESEKIKKEEKSKELKASQTRDKEILELNKHYKSLTEAEQSNLWEKAKKYYLDLGVKENFMNREMIMARVRELIAESSGKKR